jgi:hypothetical protein
MVQIPLTQTLLREKLLFGVGEDVLPTIESSQPHDEHDARECHVLR